MKLCRRLPLLPERPHVGPMKPVSSARTSHSVLPTGQLLFTIEHDTILASRTVLLDHARSAAQELARLFQEQVWNPYRESGEDPDHLTAMKSLSAHMQPIVVQALVTAFQRSLSEELRSAFRNR